MVASVVAAKDSSRAEARARLRNLHALSGVVPVGVFLVLHLWMVSSLLGSRDAYDRQLAALTGTTVGAVLELVLVLLPLAFHAIYGVWLTWQPQREAHAYPSNLAYVLQRISGIVVLVFVIAHFWDLRAQTWLFGLDERSYTTRLTEHLSWTWLGVPFVALGTLMGIAASIFHLANGMRSFLTTRGFTTTAAARRRADRLFAALGLLFFFTSSAAVIQLATGTRFVPADAAPAAPCGSNAPQPQPSSTSSTGP
ncbi:MAG: hypothetical protein KF819_25980 [Labilithrix sp.]|nr:hypothetical protein [Labilithrix sp.]